MKNFDKIYSKLVTKLNKKLGVQEVPYNGPAAFTLAHIAYRAGIKSLDVKLNKNKIKIGQLEAKNLELEKLCDATYVAQGADAYNHACSEMEDFQNKRARAGKEVGTTGSLVDGMAWLYERLDELEALQTGSAKKLSKNMTASGTKLYEYTFTQEITESKSEICLKFFAKTDLEAFQAWCLVPLVQELSPNSGKLTIETRPVNA